VANKWWHKAALQEHENAINSLGILDKQENGRLLMILCSQCQMKHWREGGHNRDRKRLQKEHEKKEKTRGGEK